MNLNSESIGQAQGCFVVRCVGFMILMSCMYQARPRDKKKGRGPPSLYAPPAPTKKDKFEDNEVIKIEIDESLFSG